MYSLVSASTLGFDLVRRPGGAAVAAVVSTALRLDVEDLAVVGRRYRDDEERRAAWIELAAIESSEPRLGPVMQAAVQQVTDSQAEPGATTQLTTTSVGHLDGLLRCIRHDVFDWTWQRSGEAPVQDAQATAALAVVCDAAAAAYHSARLGTNSAARLTTPWSAASDELPTRPLQPRERSLNELLDRLAGLEPQLRPTLRALAERPRPAGSDWVWDMHETTRVVYLTGRVREAAAAQLGAVLAFATSGLTPTDAACGGWNLVSGAVQALAVADVGDDRTVQRLLTPLLDLIGP